MTMMLALLTPDYADWELGLLSAVARGYCDIDVLTASPDGRPVVSMGGLTVTPDMAYNDIDLGRLRGLMVIGGSIWESAEAPDIVELLQAANWDQRLIGAICGGTRALAGAGLLDRVQHTSNSAAYLADIPTYRGSDFYRDVPEALRVGNIITAPGTAPVTFMRAVVGALGRGGANLDFYAEMFDAEHESSRQSPYLKAVRAQRA
jgi:putative intracellular protease/amidase